MNTSLTAQQSRTRLVYHPFGKNLALGQSSRTPVAVGTRSPDLQPTSRLFQRSVMLAERDSDRSTCPFGPIEEPPSRQTRHTGGVRQFHAIPEHIVPRQATCVRGDKKRPRASWDRTRQRAGLRTADLVRARPIGSSPDAASTAVRMDGYRLAASVDIHGGSNDVGVDRHIPIGLLQ
jgi:hypothetical protein